MVEIYLLFSLIYLYWTGWRITGGINWLLENLITLSRITLSLHCAFSFFIDCPFLLPFNFINSKWIKWTIEASALNQVDTKSSTNRHIPTLIIQLRPNTQRKIRPKCHCSDLDLFYFYNPFSQTCSNIWIWSTLTLSSVGSWGFSVVTNVFQKLCDHARVAKWQNVLQWVVVKSKCMKILEKG